MKGTAESELVSGRVVASTSVAIVEDEAMTTTSRNERESSSSQPKPAMRQRSTLPNPKITNTAKICEERVTSRCPIAATYDLGV